MFIDAEAIAWPTFGTVGSRPLRGVTGSVTGVPGSLWDNLVVFHPLVGAWRSPVARLLWEQEVLGSNPGAPTTFRLPTCNELATEVVFDVKWCY